LSRATGRGDGSVIGGRVALRLDPDLLASLSAGRDVVLVSATNGKTTTTRLTAAALGVLGPVASNTFGANMPAGHVSALAQAGPTPYAVLEVDEHYLPHVTAATKPRVIALLNLSRDQLDRAKEVALLAALWRETLREQRVHVVANADDPMVVWAASVVEDVCWVAAGQRWLDDSWVCPECGGGIRREGSPGGAVWECVTCGLRRPEPHWRLDGDTVVAPDGARHRIELRLPGRVNRANAAIALAVAAHFGVRPTDAVPRLAQIRSVAGRYTLVERDGRAIRLLLAKNPAGWLEAFEMADPTTTLLSINARAPDGFDTSWLYDVDFSPLRDRPVLITGERAFDLGVRLGVNGVPFTHVPSFADGVAATRGRRLEVIANYTAFQQIRAELDRVD